MIMPAFVLGNAIAAVLMRHTRSAMLQVLGADYVRTARAKGLDERAVVLKHALRNALVPVMTLGALEFGDAALRRGPDRAGLHHPRFRQAHRRCGLQSRLRGRAGRRAVHRDRLHPAQSAGRHRVLPGQSAAARHERGRHRSGVAARCRTGPGDARCAAWRAGAAPWSALAWSLFFILLALFAPLVAPYDPLATDWRAVRKAPSARPLFGTDEIGRDVLSRVIWGARASLAAGVVSVSIALALGVPIGSLPAMSAAWIDAS